MSAIGLTGQQLINDSRNMAPPPRAGAFNSIQWANRVNAIHPIQDIREGGGGSNNGKLKFFF